MKKIKEFLSSPRAKRGVGSLVLTVIFTAVIIALNFGVAALQKSIPALSADVTSNGMFRLSDETKNFLNGIEDDITITVLLDEEELIANDTYFKQANSIVREMASKYPNISLRYIDYADDKTLDSKYPDVTLSDSSFFLIESNSRYCVLDVTDIFNIGVDYTTYTTYVQSSKVEQALATGILTVTTDKLSKAVFLSGMSDEDITPLYNLLQENAFSVSEITLVTSDIPEDADIAIIYAPAVDLDETAAEKIREFLDNNGEGGKTLIYISAYADVELPNTDALLEEYMLALSDGMLYETDLSMIAYAENPYMSIVNYGEGAYYDSLKNQSIPFVSPYTRAVEVLSQNAEVLLYSSTESVILPFGTDEEEFNFGAAMGTPVVAAAIGSKDGSNVVVFGSSGAFANSVMQSTAFNNGAYFANLCNIVAGRGENYGVVIESKSMDSSALVIKYQSTVNILVVCFRWILPITLIIIAAVVFIMRRRK